MKLVATTRYCRWAKHLVHLHHLLLGNSASCFFAFHGVAANIHVLHKGQAKGSSAILITGKLGCENVSLEGKLKLTRHVQIAVSAFSALSNCTTPVPRERPLGSYWISARSTLPIVVKSSTRSSLLVDHGSLQLSATIRSQSTCSLHCGHRWFRYAHHQKRRNQ